jgi:hypothetical protein
VSSVAALRESWGLRESSIVLLLTNADFFLVEILLICCYGLGFGFCGCSFLLVVLFLFFFLVFFVLLGRCAVVYLLGWFGWEFFL